MIVTCLEVATLLERCLHLRFSPLLAEPAEQVWQKAVARWRDNVRQLYERNLHRSARACTR